MRCVLRKGFTNQKKTDIFYQCCEQEIYEYFRTI